MPVPTAHINAKLGDFAPTVLMPGDPMRSKFVAENFLTDPVLVNNVRGVHGYTGLYKGKRVSVMASGMGQPSMGIYSYELFNFYGVENIIRIGTAGALSPKLHLRDIVIGMSAYTNSSYSDYLGFRGHAAPCCSWKLLRAAVETAEKFGMNAVPGPIFSSDVFYDNSRTNEIMRSLGVLAVEMEASVLYLNAAMAGKNALSICTISDIPGTGESLDAEQRQISFTHMMELALEIA